MFDDIYKYADEQAKNAVKYQKYWEEYETTIGTYEYMWDVLPDDDYISWCQQRVAIYAKEVVTEKQETIRFWMACGRLDAAMTFCKHYDIEVDTMNEELKQILYTQTEKDEALTLKMMSDYANEHWPEDYKCLFEDVLADELESYYNRYMLFWHLERKLNK